MSVESEPRIEPERALGPLTHSQRSQGFFVLTCERGDSGCESIHSFHFQFTQEWVQLDVSLDAGYGFQNL